MVVYESDLKKQAIYEMEDCYDYVIDNDWKKAHRSYGRATAIEDMLLDAGIDLEAENEAYKRMKDFYHEKGANK